MRIAGEFAYGLLPCPAPRSLASVFRSLCLPQQKNFKRVTGTRLMKKFQQKGHRKILGESVFITHPAKPYSLPKTNFHTGQCFRKMITVFGVERSVSCASAVTF